MIQILQTIALAILYGEISHSLWWVLTGAVLLFYFVSKTYGNVSEDDDLSVKKFWYHARSIVFIINVISIIVLYAYIIFR
jgi:hypothetical protein